MPLELQVSFSDHRSVPLCLVEPLLCPFVTTLSNTFNGAMPQQHPGGWRSISGQWACCPLSTFLRLISRTCPVAVRQESGRHLAAVWGFDSTSIHIKERSSISHCKGSFMLDVRYALEDMVWNWWISSYVKAAWRSLKKTTQINTIWN